MEGKARGRARVAATEPALRGGTADGKKYAAMIIRSHASMNKQKKKTRRVPRLKPTGGPRIVPHPDQEPQI